MGTQQQQNAGAQQSTVNSEGSSFSSQSTSRGGVMPVALAVGGGGNVRRLQLRALCHAGFVLMTLFWGSAGAPEPSCTTAKRVNDMVVDDKASYADLVSAAACPGADVTVQWRGAVLVDEPIVVAEKASLKIVGAPGAVIDGHSTTRLLVVNAGSTVLLQDVTLQNGHALTDATEAPWGGAAFVKSQGLLSIISSRFWFNEAQEVGGAIYQDAGGKLNCTDCVFLENTADDAGGAIYQAEDGTLTCTDCEFSENKATTSGGAIYQEPGGTSACADCVFAHNAGSYGGAFDNHGEASFASCNFTSNSAANAGGAIYQNEDGTLTCIDCVFAKNEGTYGGAICQDSRTSSCTGCVFAENSGSYGGAICHHGAGLLASCDFTLNSAEQDGGAIYLEFDGTLNCTDCLFANNTAQDDGGAIYQKGGGILHGTDSVFVNNSGQYRQCCADVMINACCLLNNIRQCALLCKGSATTPSLSMSC
eukprot:TRINITY_DN611_c0_g2_i3.p1 TRINITY_DN611_c0_g2~~TRINITY_DN611_c0_g2_i3.p1  ORF type:complete len:477 (+),score=83.98 TRINITY_DN611_c0_g2_i3:231-1661(+)